MRGYLLRIANCNGLVGLRSLFSLIRKTSPEKELSLLSSLLGVCKRDLKRLTGIVLRADGSHYGLHHNGNLPLRFWNTSNSRFCALCLVESSVWQAHWELVLNVACDYHKVRLIDQCPKCQRNFRWNRKHLTECDCGQQFREIITERCTPDELWISSMLAYHLLPNALIRADTGDFLKTLNLNDLTSLLWFIGGYASGISAKPLKITGVYSMEVALQLVNAAGFIFTNWPENFHRYLYDFGSFDESSNNLSGLMKSFGFFYHSLYKNFEGKQFEFLHQAFEEFLKEHWSGTFTKRNRRLSKKLIQDHRMLPLPLAAKELHVSRKKIQQMIVDEQLTGTTRKTLSGRVITAVDRESIVKFKSMQADWISFAEARNILGQSKKRFQHSLVTGNVKALSGPSVDGSAIWKFSRASIQKISLDD